MFGRSFFAIAISAVILVPVSSLAQVSIDDRLAPGQPLAVIAHRAVGGGAPDNSLAGIRYAIERGVDIVEIDVQITHEGAYILMHDPTLTGTTNVRDVFPDGSPESDPSDLFAHRYAVRDFKLEDIARLRLSDPHGGDHPVPTLEAALELAEGRLLLLVELKNWEVESLVQVLNKYDTRNLLLWTQGDSRKLRDTAVAAGTGVAVDVSYAPDIGARLDRELEVFGPLIKLAGTSYSALTPELVSIVEERGVRVDVDTRFHKVFKPDGTVAPWVQTALDSGAAAVWTRQPGALLEVLGR